MENADADVINATIKGYEPLHAANFASVGSWAGSCPRVLPGIPCPETRLDANARNIRVPVLSILGREDRIVDASRAEEEPGYFPNSPDAQVLALDRTGHFVHDHLGQAELVASIDAWLDDHDV